MRKILIFGNSGAGKSTLAKKLAEAENLALLDLDILAWIHSVPPQRAPLEGPKEKILKFINANQGWVIEGCYTDLMEIVAPNSDEIVFMNLSEDDCVENARKRPWESHKYVSKEAQDKNLDMLINWIRQYTERDGVDSYSAHIRFYENFMGKKKMLRNNTGYA